MRWALSFLLCCLAPISAHTVVDPDGRPLQATVRLLTADQAALPWSEREQLPQQLETDEQGYFEFEAGDGAPYWLRIEAPGWAARTELLESWPTDGRWVMQPGRELQGRVADRHGRPIRATLQLCDALGAPFGPRACLETTSDRQGRYRFEGVPVDEVVVGGWNDRHAWSQHRLAAELNDVPLLTLASGSPLRGRLTQKDGTPLIDVPIQIEQVKRRGHPASEAERPFVLSDEDGSFVFPAVEPGFYKLHANRRGWFGFPSRHSAGRAAVEGIELIAEPFAQLSFDLVDPSGAPVTAEVALSIEADRPVDRALDDPRDVPLTVDDELRFRFDEIPPTATTLRITPQGYTPVFVERTSYEPRQLYDLGTLETSPASPIEGSVRDDDGRAVVGATVSVRIPDWSSGPIEATSDAEGRLRFDHLPNDRTLLFFADVQGYESVELEYAPGEVEFVDLVLPQLAGLFGRVVDPEGNPIPTFRLRLGERADEGGSAWGAGRWREMETTDGRFTLAPQRAGRYTLEVDAPGFAWTRFPITIESRRLTDAEDLQVEPGERLDGVVVDGNGAPIAGAAIVVQERELNASSDDDGEFSFDGFETGSWTFVVRHPDFAETTHAEAITEERLQRGITLALEGGGRLIGRATRSGEPVAVEIALRVAGSNRKPRTASSDPDGSFVVENLQQGSYQLTAYGPDGISFVKPRWVAIRNGVDTEVRLEPDEQIELSGIVRIAGKPLPSITIDFSRETPALVSIGATQTDENGRYDFVLPEAGSYRARIYGARLNRTLPFVVDDRPQQTQRFDLNGGSISGTVRDGEGNPVSVRVMTRVEGKALIEGLIESQSSGDGRFQLLGLAPGSYRVSAEDRRFGSVESDPIELGEQPIDGIELVLESRIPSLRGRLIDQHGLPARGGVVVAVPSGRTDSALATSSGVDMQGEWQMRAPIEGAVDLVGFIQGSSIALREGIDPYADREWLLQATAGAQLTVQFVDAEGQPLAGRFASVQAIPQSAASDIQRALSPAPVSGPDGRCQIGGLLPGRYRVSSAGATPVDVVLQPDVMGWVELVVP